MLLRCFQCCDANGDGEIDGRELEAVARAFTQANGHGHAERTAAAGQTQPTLAAPAAPATTSTSTGTTTGTATGTGTGMNVDQEVKVIMGKLDKVGMRPHRIAAVHSALSAVVAGHR